MVVVVVTNYESSYSQETTPIANQSHRMNTHLKDNGLPGLLSAKISMKERYERHGINRANC